MDRVTFWLVVRYSSIHDEATRERCMAEWRRGRDARSLSIVSLLQHFGALSG